MTEQLSIISHPGESSGDCGLAVRHRPDAREGERITVEQVWAAGDTDPVYVDRAELQALINALVKVHNEIAETEVEEAVADE